MRVFPLLWVHVICAVVIVPEAAMAKQRLEFDSPCFLQRQAGGVKLLKT